LRICESFWGDEKEIDDAIQRTMRYFQVQRFILNPLWEKYQDPE
jgi:hypothetical protein